MALVCLVRVECSARECPPLRTNNSEAFDYISTVIDSFSYLKAATTELHEGSLKAQKATDLAGMITDLMLSMKRASEDYDCAATLVNGFSKSKDKTIATSAQGTFVMYRELVRLNTEMLTVLRQILDGKLSASAMADKTSSNSVERDETYRLLTKSTSLATFPLVSVPKNDRDTRSQLNITSAQKKELTTKLELIYGSGIEKGFFAGLPLADSPAYLIYVWLNDNWQLQPSK